jgi:predicted MFS family arabinose efflux permease
MIGEEARGPARARLLAAFQVPQYRSVWATNWLIATGRLMTSLILGWLALELTDSALWVGIVAGLSGAGLLGFGVFGGVLVDRFDRRTTLIVTNLMLCGLMLLLGLLAVTGRVALWHLLLMALLGGAFDATQTPAVGVVMYQAVGRERLMNAAAGQTLSFNLGRIGGSALGGYLLEAHGLAPAFIAAAACFAAAALPMLFLKGSFRSPGDFGAFWSALSAGLRYAWTHLAVRRLLLLSSIVETLAFSYIYMLPVIARDVLGVGPAGLGWLSSVGGLGSAAGTVLMASLGNVRDKGRLLMLACLGAGVMLAAFALSRSYEVSLILAALLGTTLVGYDTLMQTLVQLLAVDEVRGRVYSLYSLTFGFNALGGFAAGAAAASVTAPVAIGLAAGLLLAYTLRMARYMRGLEREIGNS